jgi:hypothetical protein
MLASAYNVITGDEISVTHATHANAAIYRGPRWQEIAKVNAWNAGMNLLRLEKQQMFACKHWLTRT